MRDQYWLEWIDRHSSVLKATVVATYFLSGVAIGLLFALGVTWALQ